METILPVPKPLAFPFYWNRLLALATSPRKLVNYVKYLARQRTPVVHYLPVILDIEPVSRCNFHCSMCQVSDWPRYRRAEDLSFEDFKRLMDEQHGLVEVKLQGYGEPLLARDSFFQMIRYARKRHLWVRTTTNASLLHLNDNYKKLIDSGINEIQISIDGATETTFEAIRRGSVFSRVKENCKLINSYAASRGVERTRMWTTMQGGNAHEFLQFVDLASELGFTRLTYALNLHGFGQDKWIEANGEKTASHSVSPEMAAQAIDQGRRMGIEVTFWRATEKYSTQDVSRLCPWPFERAFISSDMRIVPCCLISNPSTADLGNAKQFAAAWNGEVFREYRAAHIEGRIPAYCRECYAAVKA